jgi:hypothetical protein
MSRAWLVLRASVCSLALLPACGNSSKATVDAGKDTVALPPPLPTGAKILDAVLPSPRHEPAVFSDGQVVYVAGGLDGTTFLAEIVRFDPTAGTVTVLPEVLPTPSYAAGVAWTETAAYLVGGLDKSGALSRIVRYSPSEGTATVMTAQLPKAAYNVGAVWADGVIYFVGGVAGVHSPQILRYDPAADTLTTVAATLPVGVEEPAVFWDGAWVWVLGGKKDLAGTTGTASDAIQVYDPATGEAQVVGNLPYGMWGSPAFTDGERFYLPGGSASNTTYTSIIAFDPMTEESTMLDFSLPLQAGARAGTWVWWTGAGYIFAGSDPQTGKLTNKIMQVVP